MFGYSTHPPIVDTLKGVYRKESHLAPLIEDEKISQQSLEDYYIKLEISITNPVHVGTATQTNTSTSQNNKSIELSHLFGDKVTSFQKILLTGAAGVGKTTLMHYVSYRWAQNTLWHSRFSCVFRVKLKLLLNSDWKDYYVTRSQWAERELACFIHACLPETTKEGVRVNHINTILEKQNDTMLLLLDGYDEVANKVHKAGSHAKTVFDAAMGCKHVILTSRPNAVTSNLRDKFNRVVENEGLDDKGVLRYIDNAFRVEQVERQAADGQVIRHTCSEAELTTFRQQSQSDAEQLKDFLSQNKMIGAICSIPVNIALVCLIWRDSREKLCAGNFNTSTLYKEVLLWLGRRALKKFHKDYKGLTLRDINGPDIPFEAFKDIAYKSFVQESTSSQRQGSSESLIISGSDIQKYTGMNTPKSLDLIQQFGLLKIEYDGSDFQSRGYSFIHLTFQEYLVAQRFMEKLEAGNAESITLLAQQRNKPRFLRVLQFLAAMIEEARHSELLDDTVELVVIRFWEAMVCNIEDIIELGIEDKVRLIMSLLGQVRLNQKSAPEIPNLGAMRAFVDDNVLGNINFWIRDLESSGYIPLNIDTFIKAKLRDLGQNTPIIESLTRLIVIRQYAADDLTRILEPFVEAIDSSDWVLQCTVASNLPTILNTEISVPLKKKIAQMYQGMIEDSSCHPDVKLAAVTALPDIAVRIGLSNKIISKCLTELHLTGNAADDRQNMVLVISRIMSANPSVIDNHLLSLSGMLSNNDVDREAVLALLAKAFSIRPEKRRYLYVQRRTWIDTENSREETTADILSLFIPDKANLSEIHEEIRTGLQSTDFSTRRYFLILLRCAVERSIDFVSEVILQILGKMFSRQDGTHLLAKDLLQYIIELPECKHRDQLQSMLSSSSGSKLTSPRVRKAASQLLSASQDTAAASEPVHEVNQSETYEFTLNTESPDPEIRLPAQKQSQAYQRLLDGPHPSSETIYPVEEEKGGEEIEATISPDQDTSEEEKSEEITKVTASPETDRASLIRLTEEHPILGVTYSDQDTNTLEASIFLKIEELLGGTEAERHSVATMLDALLNIYKQNPDKMRIILGWVIRLTQSENTKQTALQAKTKRGYAPLHLAVWDGHVDLVNALIEAGADTEAKNKDGATPLHIAAQSGHVAVVSALIEAGADMEAKQKDGYTPLHIAAQKGHVDVVRALIEADADKEAKINDGTTPLHIAAVNGHVDVVTTLIAAGADNEGWSPLHIAAKKGDTDLVAALIEAGADTEAKTKYERSSPLHIAAGKRDTELVAALIEAGADKEAKTNRGSTPLYIAAQSGHVAVVNALIVAGADKEAKDNNGWTPLHRAAEWDCVEVVRALIEAGADKEAKSKYGHSPLHQAAWNGYMDVVATLIAAGAGNEGWSPLHIAAEKGDTDLVATLIEAGADTEAKTKYGRSSPLHIAAEKGDTNLVAALIEAGADMEAKKKRGSTPLYIAAQSGHVAVVNALIVAGADKEAKDNNGRTPLHRAAQWDCVEVVRALIEAGADKEAKSKYGHSPLHIAAQNGYMDVVATLIAAGADNEGWSPLHIAAEKGDTDLVAALIEAGADTEAKTKYGRSSPLHIAAGKGDTDLVAALIEAGADTEAKTKYGRSSPLHIAAGKGDTDLVAALIEAGADLEAKQKNGETPLHIAAEKGRVEAAHTLLEAGANMEAKQKDGSTPLHSAAWKGHVDVVAALIDAGANIEAKQKDGSTPLLYAAAAWGHVEVVRALLEAGADKEAKQKDGSTSLHIAVQWGRVEAAHTLLEAGANMEAKQKDGWTPLNSAAQNGHVAVVNALIEAGADIDAPNNNGWTPLNSAAENGHVDVVRALIEAGAEKDAKNNNGWTPLHIAAQNGHMDVVRALIEAGADQMAKTNRGNTAMDIARQNSRNSVIDALQHTVAGKSVKTISLHSAAQKGYTKRVCALIQNGANVNARDSDQATPLQLAAEKQHVPVIFALIDAGAEVNANTKWGYALLQLAIQRNYMNILSAFVKKDADYSTMASEAVTSLQLAAEKNDIEVVSALINAGAEVNANTEWGYALLQLAAEKNCIKVVSAFLKVATEVEAPDVGYTLLHKSAHKGHIKVVSALIDAGAAINNQVLPEVFTCLAEVVEEPDEGVHQSVANTLQHLFVAFKGDQSWLNAFFIFLEDPDNSVTNIQARSILEKVFGQLSATIMHHAVSVDIGSTAFMHLSQHKDDSVAMYMAGILGEYLFYNPRYASKAHLLQLLTYYHDNEVQHSLLKGIAACVVHGYDNTLEEKLREHLDVADFSTSNAFSWHLFYPYKPGSYDFVLEKLGSERKDRRLVIRALGRKIDEVFSGDDADNFTKTAKLLRFSKVIGEEAKQEVTDEPKTHEETLSNEIILSARSLLDRASAILVKSVPSSEETDAFLRFYTYINKEFTTIFNEALRERFATLYAKFLDFETHNSTTLEPLSKDLILQFLSHGFATSFNLQTNTLSFKGVSYKICNDTETLQAFAEQAVRGSKDQNPLARQYSAYTPLFPNSSLGLSRAVVDIEPMDCLGLLSDEPLDMYTCDISLLVRINQATEDVYDSSALLLEYRDVRGYYNYAKIMGSSEGKAAIANGTYKPDDVHNHLTTIFDDMPYAENEHVLHRPLYHTLTKREDRARINELMELDYGQVEAHFTFFAEQYGSPMEAPFTLDKFKEMQTVACWNKKDLLQLERNVGDEADYRRDEASLQTRLFMDTGYAASEVARLNALINKTQSNFAALNSSAVLSEARMLELQAMQDNVGGLKASLETKLATLRSQQEADRSATAKEIANIQSELSDAIVSNDFYTDLMQKADMLDKVLEKQRQSDVRDSEVEAIYADAYKASFYNKLRRKLNAGYLAATAVISGWVKNHKAGTLGSIASFIKDVSNIIPLFGLGVNVFGRLLKMTDKKQQKKLLACYANFAVDSTEMNAFSEEISRKVVCLRGVDYNKKFPSMLERLFGVTTSAAERVVSSGVEESKSAADVEDIVLDEVGGEVEGRATDAAAQALVPDEDVRLGDEHASKVFDVIAASIFSGQVHKLEKDGKKAHIISEVRAHFT